MSEPDERLVEVAEQLYGLPLADFTPTRDARAKQLRVDDPDLANRVARLRKPSLAAWVVDLLVRREAAQVEEVLAVGAALAQAQEGMDAGALRELTKQRRQLTAAVTTRARRLARAEGVRVTDAVAGQVEATLTAAMLDETCAAVVRSGLLVGALAATAPGLTEPADPAEAAVPGAVGHVVAPVAGPAGDAADELGTAPPGLHVVPDPDAAAKARTAAQAALDEAEGELEVAQEDVEEAEEAVAELEAVGLRLSAQADEHRRALAELEAQAEDADEELEEAEATRAQAETALASARRDRDAAAAALDRLG